MARRNDHSREQIQQMAIAAAISILNQQGANKLSARRIAREIGYTVGTLYLVFKNLDELILRVNLATLDELQSAITMESGKYHDPQAKIRAMAYAYMQYAREHYARWSLLFTHHLTAMDSVPEWLEAKVREVFELVEEPLRELKPGLDKAAYLNSTRVLWSGVHGACELALNDKLSLGYPVSSEELIDALVENYMAGLRNS